MYKVLGFTSKCPLFSFQGMTQTGSRTLDPVFCCFASGTAGQLSGGEWERPLADCEAKRPQCLGAVLKGWR